MTATTVTLSGRYELTSRIAVGGMGEVWQAADLLLHRDVAVKLLKAEYLQDPGFLERFRAEARHTAGLSHPGIAAVYDYGEVNGAPYLVMELVRGAPLSAILAESGALPIAQALDIAAQTARALGAAHAAGVVHRDVKPGNILIAPDGVVKVTDFGIARAMDAVPLTQTGTVLGTATYLSPEQASGKTTMPASDLYSLGVVTYEMVAGYRPFAASNPVAVALAHLNDPPEPLPDDIPEPVRALVMQALAKSPADRPADAAAFAAAADRAASSAGGAVSSTSATVVGAVSAPVGAAAAAGHSTRVLKPVTIGAAGGAALASRRRLPGRWIVMAGAVALALLVALLLDRDPPTTTSTSSASGNPAASKPAPVGSAAASPSAPTTVRVPATLVGLPYEKAATAVVKLSLTPDRRSVVDPQPAGIVIAAEPPAGTPLRPGSILTLVTSSGPAKVVQAPTQQPEPPGKRKGKKGDNDEGDD